MRKRTLMVALSAISVIAETISPMSDQRSPQGWFLTIGLRKQLFVDDIIVSERKNVARTLGQATKVNDGKPIFEDAWCVTTLLRDADLLKMWYIPRGQDFQLATEGKWAGAYAESKDGLHWTKKAEVTGLPFLYGPVFLDFHETDPAHKFKTAQWLNPHPPARPGITPVLAHSADGLHWTLYNNGMPVTGPSGDFTNQIDWDEQAKVYRLFERDEDVASLDQPLNSRSVRLLINPDVKANAANWTTVRSWKLDRDGLEERNRRQIYHMNDWFYEGVHFGLMAVYEWPTTDRSEGRYDTYQRHERDIMNFYVSASRDAENWDFGWVYSEKPMIPRGASGSFDKDAVYPCPTVVTFQDKHWLYYSGGRERHNAYAEFYDKNGQELYAGAIQKYSQSIRNQYNTCLATVRLDRFVSLEAKDEPAMVITKPFKLEGSNLEVNVDAQNGEVSVEVLNAPQSGTPIPGLTQKEAKVFRGVDELRLRPSWNNQANLAAMKGKIVRLTFHLRNAKLYAFQVQP